ncbi:hypothetical protein AVEN_17120-1 [Araneus ventricosus]|uniref:Helitron helicase-like domain-containing protein n=1 Tax=Araneus ventricosus TaxID=182803 RepID=A0A4Y2NGR6_ARAVE|nr:hypothetical protein AVEN_17120-1 [Araneus ventricosus]
MGRCISSNEEIWRIFNFTIHERHLILIYLNVHLENSQSLFHDRKCCSTCPNTSGNNTRLLPEYEGIRSSDPLGRVYTVHPTNSECFHMRLLLHEVRSPMSFIDLRTFEGRVCETYKQACQLRGLLEYDEHWNKALEEEAASRSPKILRNLFAVMLLTCPMSSPKQLWMDHKEKLSRSSIPDSTGLLEYDEHWNKALEEEAASRSPKILRNLLPVMLLTCSMSSPKQLWMDHTENLSEDILHQAGIQQQNMDLDYCGTIFNRALIDIEDKIILLGGSDLKCFDGLRNP